MVGLIQEHRLCPKHPLIRYGLAYGLPACIGFFLGIQLGIPRSDEGVSDLAESTLDRADTEASRRSGEIGDRDAESTEVDLVVARARLMEAAQQSGRPDFEALNVWVQGWAKKDPMGLFAFLKEMRSSGGNRWLCDFITEQLGRSWGQTEPDAAFLASDTIGDWRLRQSFSEHILRGLSTVDPQGALDALGSRPELDRRSQRDVAYTVYQNWAHKDPSGAFAHASSAAHPDDRRLIQTNLARIYGESRPDKAYEWARNLEDPYDKRLAVVYAIRGAARVDLELAENFLSDLEDAQEDGFLINQVKGQLLEETSLYNQEEALALLDKTPAGGGRMDAIQRMAAHKAGLSPEQALTWSASLPMAEEQMKAQSAALNRWSAMDPAMAAAYVLQEDSSNIDNGLLGIMAERLSEKDPEAGIAFYFTRELEYQDESTTESTLLSNLMQTEPERAAELLNGGAASFQEPTILSSSIMQWVAASAADIDPILDFVEDAQLDPTAYAAIARGWANIDPFAASEWALDMEKGVERQTALENVLAQTAFTYPERTLAFAIEVQNPTKRLVLLEDAIQAIARKDLESAYESIADFTLTDQERDHLQRQLDLRYAPKPE